MKLKLVLLIGIIVMLTLGTGIPVVAENLLPNSAFEDYRTTSHSGTWFVDYWQNYSNVGITEKKVHSGRFAAFIRSIEVNDVRLVQSVSVEPDTVYRYSGWVATDSVAEYKIGASLCIMGGQIHSPYLTGNRDWQQVEVVFRTRANQTKVTLGVRLGYYFNTTTGLAYFDDLKLERLDMFQGRSETLDEASASFTVYSLQQLQVDNSDPGLGFKQKLVYYLLRLLNYPFATVVFYMIWLVAMFLCANKYTLNLFHIEDQQHFQKKLPWFFGATALLAIILRIPLLPEAPFSGDTALFYEWSKRIIATGPGAFYTPDYFCDYPPFALYIMWGLGTLGKALHLIDNFTSFTCLFKVPGILCDLGVAWLITLFFKKKNPVMGWLLSVAYLFLPSIIINSAYWGQVDCYYAFLVLSAFYLLTVKQQPEWAACLAMASLLTKTQTVAFLPLLFIYLFF